MHRRPDRRLRRPVHVPQRAAARQQPSASSRGSASPPHSTLKPGSPAQPASTSIATSSAWPASPWRRRLPSRAASSRPSAAVSRDATTTVAPPSAAGTAPAPRCRTTAWSPPAARRMPSTARARAASTQEVDHVAVLDLDALGQPGRARRVDDVRQLTPAPSTGAHRCAAMAAASAPRPPTSTPTFEPIGQRHPDVTTTDNPKSATMNPNRSPGNPDPTADTPHRLQHPQQRHHHRHRPLDRHPHEITRQPPPPTPDARQPIRPPLQLPVRHRLPTHLHRHTPGERAACATNSSSTRTQPAERYPVSFQLATNSSRSRRRQQRRPATGRGIGHHGRQQRHPVLDQPLDRRPDRTVRVVLEVHRGAGALGQVHRQLDSTDPVETGRLDNQSPRCDVRHEACC